MTNNQINERSLLAQELYKTGTDAEDEIVQVDQNFEAMVETWTNHGQTLQNQMDEGLSAFLLTTLPNPVEMVPVATADEPQDPQGQSHQPSQPPPHSQFTPQLHDLGGRLRKPSPIRQRRTHKSVLVVSPVSSHHSSPSGSVKQDLQNPPYQLDDPPPPPKTVFRRYGKYKELDAQVKPAPKQPRHTQAAPTNDEAALHDEDVQLRQKQFDQWLDPEYQLRFEEGLRISDMLTALCQTLQLGAVVIVDQGDSIKYQMSRINTTEVQTLNGLTVSRDNSYFSVH